jgi:hypothetical protein
MAVRVSEDWLRRNYRDADRVLSEGTPAAPSGRKAAHERFVMNRTEGLYAAELDRREAAGEIRGWEFERVTFRLGPEMTFTPDFSVEGLDGLFTFVDVKGKHTFEDSTIKVKAAAVLFPQHGFAQARLVAGAWKERFFKSS